MQKKLLASAWQSYAQRVLPPTASNNQRIETRRAFYAGAAALRDGFFATYKMSDEDALEVMKRTDEELLEFAKDVKEGRG